MSESEQQRIGISTADPVGLVDIVSGQTCVFRVDLDGVVTGDVDVAIRVCQEHGFTQFIPFLVAIDKLQKRLKKLE